MYCPGCGGSRAFLYILQLRFRESFLANPLVIILIIETIVLSIIYIYDVIIHKSKYIFYSITKKTFICTLIFGLIFFILRNVALIIFKYDFLGDFIT